MSQLRTRCDAHHKKALYNLRFSICNAATARSKSLLKPDEFTKMNIGVGNVTYTIGLFQLLSGEKRIPCGRRLRENTPRLCSRHRMMALSLRVAASVHPQGLNLWRMAKLREFNQGCIIFRDFPKRRGNVIQEAAGVALRSHPSGYPPEYFVFG